MKKENVRLKDLKGECEMLAKKTVIFRLQGNQREAARWAQEHQKVLTAPFYHDHRPLDQPNTLDGP